MTPDLATIKRRETDDGRVELTVVVTAESDAIDRIQVDALLALQHEGIRKVPHNIYDQIMES